MSTKIIVTAFVVLVAILGSMGVAAAYISTQTEISGERFSSVSKTHVSNMDIYTQYTQQFKAELKEPGYPQYDFSYTNQRLRGNTFSATQETRSSPTENRVSSTITTPSAVTGTMARYNCALMSQGKSVEVVKLPQPIYTSSVSYWQGRHPAGAVYPGHSRESMYIGRP